MGARKAALILMKNSHFDRTLRYPNAKSDKILLIQQFNKCRLVSHTHTHTIDVIVDVRMTSCDVIVGIRMTSLPVYGHTECDCKIVTRKAKSVR